MLKAANFGYGKFISCSLTENSGQKLLPKNMVVIRCLHTKWEPERRLRWQHPQWKPNGWGCVRKVFLWCQII